MQLRNLEPAQTVRHMNLKRRLRVTHGGVRVGFGSQRLEDAFDLPRRGLPEPVPGY
jgi:hypothetical protein